jgi:hypothetical protein
MCGMQILAILILIGIAVGLLKLCFGSSADCGQCAWEGFCECCGPPLYLVLLLVCWGGAIALIIFLIGLATGSIKF